MQKVNEITQLFLEILVVCYLSMSYNTQLNLRACHTRVTFTLRGRGIFFIKEHSICAINRRHADPNINILLTRNLPFNWSDVRRWSRPLMIPLHYCLWANLNTSMCGQFECDLTCFCFYFVLVCSHTLCDCCYYVFKLPK